MPELPNDRPLLARLIARTEKYQDCTTNPVAADITLHQQSVDEINRLTAENERLRRFAERQRQMQDVPFLKNYAPFRDLDKPTQKDMDALVDQLRKTGLSIDGDNAYKRDLLDSVVGAMAFGVQNRNPPPAGHWGQRFWDIGREERAPCEKLVAALSFAVERWTILANEFKHTTPEHERELAEISKAQAAIAKATQ
ncbi:hypothetical protein QF019_002408 [Pseudomonas frederiksbergensis]|uniref:hypothetical protein n=1 Tax=Pseudomonas frederiksbergensis TaxID=104087 RepID=UPI003D1EBBF7